MEFQSFRKSFSGDTWTLYIVNQAGRDLTSKQPRILNPKQDTDMKTYRGCCVHLGTNPYPQVGHSLRDGSGLRSRHSFYYLESFALRVQSHGLEIQQKKPTFATFRTFAESKKSYQKIFQKSKLLLTRGSSR